MKYLFFDVLVFFACQKLTANSNTLPKKTHTNFADTTKPLAGKAPADSTDDLSDSTLLASDSTGGTKYKPSSNTGGRVSVKGYYRKNGTYVKPYTRSAPKSHH